MLKHIPFPKTFSLDQMNMSILLLELIQIVTEVYLIMTLDLITVLMLDIQPVLWVDTVVWFLIHPVLR